MIKLHLNVTKQSGSDPLAFIRIGDGDVDGLEVSIIDKGEPMDLTGFTVSFEGVTSVGKTVIDSVVKMIDETQGKFQYKFPSQASSSIGRYQTAYFSLVKDNVRTTTDNFEVYVLESSNIFEIEPDDYINPYNSLIAKLNESYDTASKDVSENAKQQMEVLDSQAESLKEKVADYIEGRDVDFEQFKTDFDNLVSDTTAKVAMLRGPEGPKGPIGPQGDPGVQGVPGITVKGALATVDKLPADATVGDAYFVRRGLMIKTADSWKEINTLMGPQGEKGEVGTKGDRGDPGPIGETGPQGVSLTRATGNDEESAIANATSDPDGFFYWEES